MSRTHRILGLTALGLSVAGVGLSAYLTAAHYAASSILLCSSTGAVDCAKVTTSSYSHIAGVPVAVLGLVYYLVMLGLCLPRSWADPRLRTPRTWAATGGMAFVAYLIYAELYGVHAICLWCTAVHVVTFGLFAVVLGADFAAHEAAEPESRRDLSLRR
ncbi:MAG TPA: vitamin K epoxide reductase family protein [Acidimicrobiales bacterium]|nr:vitamin K epoxide reductase family protein [Acidimicrobiales bacterium]